MGVGLDIGSKTVKEVEIEKEGTRFALKASGIVGYKGQSIEHLNDEKELGGVAELIMKLHKESGVSSKDITIALPETLVFTRLIRFPALTDQEIASAIKWEAEQYIPIPLNEAIVQHEIIERNETINPPYVSVLLVAAPRSLVEKYVKVVQMARLNPVFVETELISLVRALAPEDQTSLLLDFGARSTDIAISKNKSIVFSRSIPTAGEAFTRAVAQGLGIDHQQAEQYKMAYGFSQNELEGKIKAAIDPVFRTIVDEIKKAIHFYQTEEKGDRPRSAILSGGTAGIPQVIHVLSETLGMDVSIANPFSDLKVKEDVMQKIAPYAPLYSIAVGLALR